MGNKNAVLQTITILIFVTIPEYSFPQDFYFIGPRSYSLANTSTTLADEYSLFNNPATLGLAESGSITCGYADLFRIEGLNSVFASFSIPVKTGSLSIGAISFGDDIYSQNRLSIGFGNRFGLAALGFSTNYQYYHFEGFESFGFLTLDVGGVAEISPVLSLSGIVKNITQTRISEFTGEYFPTLMSAGIMYNPSDQLLLNVQYDKDLDHPGVLKFGLEYTYSSLIFRTGLITDPATLSFGLGFHHRKLKIDFGIMNHQTLDVSHTVSISYCFKNE